MLNKKIMILALILLSLLTISGVSASEITSDASDLNADNSILGVNENEQLESSPDGTFTDLASEIANSTTYELNLTRNYVFSDGDDEYQLGIIIDNALTINGNGFSINGNNQARAFDINSSYVNLNNIYFVNCSASNNGGAISWHGDDGTISDCIFENCSAGVDGGAVYWFDSFNGTVYGCKFVACSAGFDAGAIYWYNSYGLMFGCNFTNRSDRYDDFVSNLKNTTIWNITVSILSKEYNFDEIIAIGNITSWANDIFDRIQNITFIDNLISGIKNTALWNSTLSLLENYNLSEIADNISSWANDLLDKVQNSSFVDNLISEIKNTTLWNSTLSLLDDYNLSEIADNISAWANDIISKFRNDSYIENITVMDNITIWNYTIGNYIIKAYYDSAGILNFGGIINLGIYEEIHKLDVNLSAVYDADAGKIVATLLDNYTGIPIMFENVVFIINDENYTVLTNLFGEAKFSTENLTPGSYSVDVLYDGDLIHKSATTTVDVDIDVDVGNGTVISAIYDANASEIIATLYDNSTAIPIPIMFANVRFTINGENYTARTNLLGKAKLSTADFAPGSYSADIAYDGNILFDPANTTISFAIKGITNLSAVYNNGEIIATLINEATGQPIKSANIRFAVNGEKYTVKTNSSGQAKLDVSSLAPGTYTADVSYYGNSKFTPSNTSVYIVVSKVITDISVFYDSNAKEVVAVLVRAETGKAISGANVVFKVNGVKTIVKTDKQGEARVAVEGDLSTFDVQVSYGGNSKFFKSTASIKVVEGKVPTSISLDYDAENDEVVATLINVEAGKIIKGANVVFNIHGNKPIVKTDKDGQAAFSIADLDSGVHTISVSYGGNSKYAKSTTSIMFVKP